MRDHIVLWWRMNLGRRAAALENSMTCSRLRSKYLSLRLLLPTRLCRRRCSGACRQHVTSWSERAMWRKELCSKGHAKTFSSISSRDKQDMTVGIDMTIYTYNIRLGCTKCTPSYSLTSLITFSLIQHSLQLKTGIQKGEPTGRIRIIKSPHTGNKGDRNALDPDYGKRWKKISIHEILLRRQAWKHRKEYTNFWHKH